MSAAKRIMNSQCQITLDALMSATRAKTFVTPTTDWVPVSDFPECAFMMVKPEVARSWLKRNMRNRDQKCQRIERYTDAINNDMWMPSPQGIGFDVNGALVDGQHRLMSIAAAGVPAVLLVSWGLDPDVIAVIDDGAKRRAADVMQIDGVGDYYEAAIYARAIHNIATADNGNPSNLQITMTYEKHKSDIDWLIGVTKKPGQYKRVLQFVGGALCVAHKKAPDETDRLANEFWTGIGVKSRSPASALIRYANESTNERLKSALKTFVACWHQVKGSQIVVLKPSDSAFDYFVSDKKALLP